ncbi:hypothetical protein CKA32_000710 [Geitlerinema sp. FC II]|nr:hypothetical protein CKA32_000710 [Geitlerinema sp. FC II]
MFQSLEGIFGFFNFACVPYRVIRRQVSIPRRDFWVFQL